MCATILEMIDTSKYQKKLEAELATLTTQLRTLGVENPKIPGDWVTSNHANPTADLNDVADRTESFNQRRATLAQLETRYRNLKLALEKIDQGTYGVCEVNGKMIEKDRLDANPAARTCKDHLEVESELD